MSVRRVRALLAVTAAAAVLSYGLGSHALPQMSGHDGMAGAAAGLCLLLATALVVAVVARPEARGARVRCITAAIAFSAPPPPPLDGRSRASPSALGRFRN